MKIADLPKPFIICEVSSAWSSWEHCKDAIGLAKNCGADAVKFQMFSQKDLYGREKAKPDGERRELATDPATIKESDSYAVNVYHEYKESGESPYLHHGWLEGLKQKADAVGIELMVSAFSVEGLEYVDKYVNIHKLASSENNHFRMLQKLRELGKPVLLSTGGSSHGDVQKSIAVLTDEIEGAPPPVEVMPLYCVSDYPARTIDLSQLSALRTLGSGVVGFSDHSTDSLVIPQRAVELGAEVVEKHVNFFDVDCPDSPHSLSTKEFKAMCDQLKGRPVSPSGQKDMYLKHNRRLIASKPVKAGEVLVEGENFGIFRSLREDANAMSPFNITRVAGRKAKRDLEAGEGIGPADV